MAITPIMARFISETISRSRLTNYHNNAAGGTDFDAIKLYTWNAQVSASLLFPIALFEVVVRNAVSEALTNVYGPNWHQDNTFQLSLPDNQNAYSPRRDLRLTARSHPIIGKTIAELKFVFWRDIFTKRHDTRIWNSNIKSVFPNAAPQINDKDLRKLLYASTDKIRVLRNRIAHHEPIFLRNIQSEFDVIKSVIEMRCSATYVLLNENETFTQIMSIKP